VSVAVLLQRANLPAAVHLSVLPAVPSGHTYLAQGMTARPPWPAGPPKSLSQRTVYIAVGRFGT